LPQPAHLANSQVTAPAARYEAAQVGWIAASAVSRWPVYRGVIEHSVYVHLEAQGRGVGTALLDALIGSTEAAGIWTIQTGIFPEKTTSLQLHQRAGFRAVGTRQRIGWHHRPLARRHPPRTPQHHHWDLTGIAWPRFVRGSSSHPEVAVVRHNQWPVISGSGPSSTGVCLAASSLLSVRVRSLDSRV
jgi:GNAT superfamily N-acetyltransferase